MAAEVNNDYLLNNDSELARQALQHVIIQDAMKGRQVFAPLQFDVDPLRILDVCTGNGLWIRDLQASKAMSNIQHRYTGTDIEASYFPDDALQNTNYHVQDITKPWPAHWNADFDFVHQRLALAVPGDEKRTLKVLQSYISLLKPGGWIQLVELRHWTKETDCQAFKDLTVCLSDMIKTIESNLEHIDRTKSWLETLGLVDVQEDTVEANYGTRDNKEVQHIAKRAVMMTAGSILAFPQQLLSLPVERVQQIEDELEKELASDFVGAHWQYKIVWGRRPL